MRMKYGNISIKWKIYAYLLGFCGLLLVLMWLFQVVFLDSFYKTIKIKEVKDSASSIMKNLESENLEELVKRISVSNNVCVEILSENGNIVCSSDVLPDCIIHRMPLNDKMKLLSETAKNGGELLGYYNRDSFRDDIFEFDKNKFIGRIPVPVRGPDQTIIYSKIMTDEENNTVILLINSVISPVDATVKTLRVQLYYITGFMILFSVFLALVISRKVSKPIEAINDSAKKLASGKYDVLFDSTGYREIKELSDTLAFTARELSKLENLRKELIANISHDLRTPLTLIGGYAEIMRDLPDENSPENAQIIIDEAQRLSFLVNDVLDISKLQSGTQALTLEESNLTQLIGNAVDRMQELVKKDGYSIKFIYETEAILLFDETRISQAFYNLLINAINYSGTDKIVVVKQNITESEVKIEVIDTGKGIDPKDLPHIWDRYYKADKSNKQAVPGTGLGLSIVKSIIEMHKGKYGVMSKVDDGSIFWFSLKYSHGR
jgi:signal transduction histidine kinase